MQFKSIVVLTGAGISEESGIRTFRGSDGLWEGHRIEDVATPEAFARNPKLVHEFYNERRRQIQTQQIKPNNAHISLAEFEKRFEGNFLLVTQNVDDLHERAGSKNLRHMHGELLKVRCVETGEVYEWKHDLDLTTAHPKQPNRRGTLRPHIVWFGEMPFYMDEIMEALEGCDLFISIGTSGLVYPAAGFVQWCQPHCTKVELNLDDTPVSPLFNRRISGKAGTIVPEFLKTLK
jgi:NAD-dependent deacetylase